MAALSSVWNVGGQSTTTQRVKMLVTVPLPNTTAAMRVASGHVLKIPDHRLFDTHEHKLLLRALADTWGAGKFSHFTTPSNPHILHAGDNHSHVVGKQGLCYTISRDYLGHGRCA